jgi:hypothetical protein
VRRLVRVGLAVLAVVAVAALAVSLWLPRFVRSEGFAARLREAVRESTGQEPSWSALEVGLLPLRLRVEALRLGDGSALAAEEADLRVDWLPLLARAVVVDRVSIQGGRLRVVRTAQGLVWPWSGTPAEDAAPATPGGEPPGGAARLAFAVRRVDVERGTLALEDRTATPPLVVELVDVEGSAQGSSPEAPVEVELEGRLASGGRVRAEGRVAPAAELDLVATLDEVALAPFASLAGRDVRLGGAASGRLHARGPARAPDALDLELAMGEAAFVVGDARVAGPVSLRAELRGELARPAGSFSIDATRAEMTYGGAFRKPPGSPASAEGRFATSADGRLRTEGVRVRIQNVGGDARIERGGDAPTVWGLELPPFDAAELAALSPDLAPWKPAGRVALAGFELAAATPPGLAGRLALDPLRLEPEGRGPIELRGALVGRDGAIASEGLVADVGGQRVEATVEVTGLALAPQHHVTLAARGADGAALIAALSGERDAMEGPVTFDADLRGPLAGGGATLEQLTGEVRFTAGPGRIPGVAPLAAALDEVGTLRAARRDERLRPYTRDRFESAGGRVEIGGGLLRSDDLELRYRGYSLHLRGTMQLADRRLDARGRLRLDEELVAALADRPAAAGAGPRELELAHVGGTPASPQVEVEAQAALGLAATLATVGRRADIERKIDRALGDGAGRDVLQALDGLLAPHDETKQ